MSNVSFYVGVDLGNQKHAICVLDAQRRLVKSGFVENDERLLDIVTAAIGTAAPAGVHVALEDRNNVVVDGLLARGFAVFTANPKQIDRFRDRETVAGAKDDRRDASVLANALATDARVFQRVAVQSEFEVQLGSLAATLNELDEDHRRIANRLRAVVLRFFPALLSLCQGTNEKWFWALLLLLGDADGAKAVPQTAIAALLKAHGKRVVKVEHIVAIIEGRHLATGPGVKEACGIHAASLVKQLLAVEEHRAHATAARDAVLEKLMEAGPDCTPSDVAILRSMPGVGPKTVTALLCDCLPLLIKSGDLERVRALSGVAPVTKQSGKGRRVTMRYACNPRLRFALFHLATNAIRPAGRLKEKYTKLREKGHNHARALRAVADLVLHILRAMLKDRTTYVNVVAPVVAAVA
jgi:transposase